MHQGGGKFSTYVHRGGGISLVGMEKTRSTNIGREKPRIQDTGEEKPQQKKKKKGRLKKILPTKRLPGWYHLCTLLYNTYGTYITD